MLLPDADNLGGDWSAALDVDGVNADAVPDCVRQDVAAQGAVALCVLQQEATGERVCQDVLADLLVDDLLAAADQVQPQAV